MNHCVPGFPGSCGGLNTAAVVVYRHLLSQNFRAMKLKRVWFKRAFALLYFSFFITAIRKKRGFLISGYDGTLFNALDLRNKKPKIIKRLKSRKVFMGARHAF